MKPKAAVTVLLLAFVVASVGFLILEQKGDKSAPLESSGRSSQGKLNHTKSARSSGSDRRVVVYYFHGDTRCNTCRTIESYTKEAINTDYSKELESGRLEWRVVNVEDAGNEHFIDDYELSTRTVVLSELSNGQEVRWTKLERVWQLVRNKEEFVAYINENTGKYLAGRDG